MFKIPARTRSVTTTVAKFAFAGFVVFVLLKYRLLDPASLRGLLNNPVLILAALVLLFGGNILSGIRWWILLRTFGRNEIAMIRVLQLQLIGSFFSSLLPGAAGGDAARGLYLYRLLDSGRSMALLSIVVDRIFALIGLLSCAAITCVLLLAMRIDGPATRQYQLLTGMIFASGAIVLIVTVGLSTITSKYNGLHWMPSSLRQFVIPIRTTVIISLQNPWPMLLCWFLSVTASAIVITGMILIANTFSYSPSPAIVAAGGVFGNLFSAIPVTPGGVGIGESIFAKTCAQLGGKVSPYASIYFAFRLCTLLVNFSGLAAYLLHKKSEFRA